MRNSCNTGNNVWSQIWSQNSELWSHLARYKCAIMINSHNYKKYEVAIMRMKSQLSNLKSKLWEINEQLCKIVAITRNKV